HSVTNIPVQGLSGSHAYAQGKVAGTNAAGGQRRYQPVSVPWGMVAGDWMIGGVSFSETLATALGIPHVVGVAEGISRARYYPGGGDARVNGAGGAGLAAAGGPEDGGGWGHKGGGGFSGLGGQAQHPQGRPGDDGNLLPPADRGAERADRPGGPGTAGGS